MNNTILVPTEEDFEAWLDEQQPEIVIGDRRFYHSVILKKCDPEYYQELFERYCDEVVSDQIDAMEANDEPIMTSCSASEEPITDFKYYPIAFLSSDLSIAIEQYENNSEWAAGGVSI